MGLACTDARIKSRISPVKILAVNKVRILMVFTRKAFFNNDSAWSKTDFAVVLSVQNSGKQSLKRLFYKVAKIEKARETEKTKHFFPFYDFFLLFRRPPQFADKYHEY